MKNKLILLLYELIGLLMATSVLLIVNNKELHLKTEQMLDILKAQLKSIK
jgi:hypothetical protein